LASASVNNVVVLQPISPQGAQNSVVTLLLGLTNTYVATLTVAALAVGIRM